jgi:Xaa-Pro aminopeptidase
MNSDFYKGNRQKLYESLKPGTVVALFSGQPIRKTADENYPFYASRNFVYMTGIDRDQFILLAEKGEYSTKETIFILPSDAHAERWTGRRLKKEEVEQISGIENIRYAGEFDTYLLVLMKSGKFNTISLDLYKNDVTDINTEAFKFAGKIKKDYPHINIENVLPQIRKQRTIKQPCEIEAIKEAVKITRDGIVAMMKASKPGMYEYQYRAEFDYALAQHGDMEPSFPPIISTGDNNFCIHYYDYNGQAKDGDMILNDVGAKYDYMMNDVSRAFPCNGKFNEKQRMLYTCAYNTSEYMFSIIKPGMPMADVDKIIKEYNFEQLHAIGLCEKFEYISKYMWHGGAHHVGFDCHDIVDPVTTIEAGMVFCVDIGIYCEEWGIGFRLEDNCLVTEKGCENLTIAVPRTIEEIEQVMGARHDV